MVYVYAWCRWGAILSNGHLVSLMKLQQSYLCNECEGGVIVRTVQGKDGQVYYRAQCADCGGRLFISKWLLERQRADWWRITMHLPKELREIVDQYWKKGPTPGLTYDRAITELYGGNDGS